VIVRFSSEILLGSRPIVALNRIVLITEMILGTDIILLFTLFISVGYTDRPIIDHLNNIMVDALARKPI